MEKARQAQARGDLRAAQIEYRNAVRSDPNSGSTRAALAAASLDLGDGDTGEKEARAALERGYDPVVAGTALLMRAYFVQDRAQDLLRDFPFKEEGTPPAVAAQVAAGRALAQLTLTRPEEAERSVADALRLAPNSAEVQLAAAAVAAAKGDRDGAEAATDRALAIEPSNEQALMRKGILQAAHNDAAGRWRASARSSPSRAGNVAGPPAPRRSC